MKTTQPVSPYLRRPLRSLREVLQARRKGGGSAKSNYGLETEDGPDADNNNAPAPSRDSAKTG